MEIANSQTSPNTMIAAERRRKIYDWVLEYGSVNVAWLAEALAVGANTIRHDLDVLQREGKVVRSHGGAVLKEARAQRESYDKVRNMNIQEKAWIGEAALRYLPEEGSIFISDGTTTFQLASRLPRNTKLHVITVSPQVALQVAGNTTATVDLLGGRIRQDSFATDTSLSEEALDMMYWDVTFMGLWAIDLNRGLTSIDRSSALYEKKLVKHGSKVVALCDSSKFGKFSYAMLGPVDMIDVIITDNRVSTETIDILTSMGVEVVLAGPDGALTAELSVDEKS